MHEFLRKKVLRRIPGGISEDFSIELSGEILKGMPGIIS